MAEEWRVSLILDGRGGRSQCRDLLRSRFGDDIAVSAEKACIFLYTESEKAAGEAEYVAREVLAQQGLTAEFRIEQWDPSGGEWRGLEDLAEYEDEHDDEPEPGRLRSTATALIKGAAWAAMWGDF